MTEEEIAEEDKGVESRLEVGKYLPPLYRLKIPQTTTQTAKVKWLYELGYPVKAIASGLGVRYQQVRNMITTVPKRAAREDLPPLTIEVLELADDIDMLLDGELDRTFFEARKAGKRIREPRKDGKPRNFDTHEHEYLPMLGEDEVDEITEQDQN